MGLSHVDDIREVWSRIGKGSKMFKDIREVWGRYAPSMAAKHFCAPFLSNRNLTKMTRWHVPNSLVQIGLKLPSLSRQHMSDSPGKCEKYQANFFLSYILREEMGGKKYPEMGGKKQPKFVCYADDGVAVGVSPQISGYFCPAYLDYFCPAYLFNI